MAQQQTLPPITSLTDQLTPDTNRLSQGTDARDSGNWSVSQSKRKYCLFVSAYGSIGEECCTRRNFSFGVRSEVERSSFVVLEVGICMLCVRVWLVSGGTPLFPRTNDILLSKSTVVAFGASEVLSVDCH